MKNSVTKTISFLGRDIDIIFPSQETINDMKRSHRDRIDLGEGLFLDIELLETYDSRMRKFFRVKTTVSIKMGRELIEHRTVPVAPDKVLETLSEEIDLTLENVEANIKALYIFSKRDTENLGELASKFDNDKTKSESSKRS